VLRVQPSCKENKYKIVKLVLPKLDCVSYKCFYKLKVVLIYVTDSRLASNHQVLRIIKNLRGGSKATAVYIGIIILILSQGTSFVTNNVDWRVN
jgi:hypothetical protein